MRLLNMTEIAMSNILQSLNMIPISMSDSAVTEHDITSNVKHILRLLNMTLPPSAYLTKTQPSSAYLTKTLLSAAY